jgi:hypothetical protein
VWKHDSHIETAGDACIARDDLDEYAPNRDSARTGDTDSHTESSPVVGCVPNVYGTTFDPRVELSSLGFASFLMAQSPVEAEHPGVGHSPFLFSNST